MQIKQVKNLQMVIIRKATKDDIKTLVDFQLRMANETENLYLDNQTVTNGVKAVLDDENKGIYYVAVEKKQVIGMLLTTFEWSDWRNCFYLWLQSVYVQQESRGKGVFVSLYNYIKADVKGNENIRGIRLYVDRENEIAQKVYTKLGMNGEHYKVFEWMKKR